MKVFPSFGDLAFLTPIIFLFGHLNGVKTLLEDCDTGWHIRTGQWIVANHQAPVRDIFSYSRPGELWFAWEWLSDVIFAGLNALGGLGAVVLFSMLVLSVTFGLVFGLARRKSNTIVAIGVTLLSAAASSLHWLARPHIFTLLFVVLFYIALDRVQQGNTRLAGMPVLAILPAVTVLWTNLHGGFFVGVMMIAVFGIGEVLEILLVGEAPGAWTKAARYFACSGACLAASLLNPYGYRLHEHLLAYMRDPFASAHIQEFFSPNFHNPSVFYFEIMLVFGALAACWNISNKRFTEPMLLLLWTHASFLAGRNIAIFAIVAAAPLARFAQEWLDRLPEFNISAKVRNLAAAFQRTAAGVGEAEAISRWHVVSGLAFAIIAAIIWAPNPPQKFRAEFDPSRYPTAALATLRSDPAARIFTDDEWGDYLIWKLYPQHKVFVDGRSDFYGDDFEEKFVDVLNVNYDWEQTLGRYRVDTILLPTTAPLAGALKESGRWRVVFDDGSALVFRSTTKSVGTTGSVARSGNGGGRDRKVTKTEACDRSITETKKQLT